MSKGKDNQHPAGQAEHAFIGILGNGREVARLHLLFLVPLAVAILAILMAQTLALYWHEHQSASGGFTKRCALPQR